ncbi:MFS transporter [Ovoidimarina sediminis]|uniref:MFS transporter n=1 Tax=Ovoidimarina sediminis TaxID=3079856 RepID=UPI00290D255D|nr:MFS transporter [Rhodophyticola sp. MJ-SS7]MDU8944466.1 MFS transporter [Rhodophyticola sp. MJ-SS7]
MTATRASSHSLITPVLIAGSVILIVNFAIRSAFGVFQIPIADEFGWLRAEFSTAIAIQNLAWGIGQPIFGAIAEKLGERKAVLIGILIYAAGLLLTSFAVSPGQMQVLEMAVGFGIAGTGFGLILAMVGRAASDENRSMAMAIATAAGSMGQVIGPPLAEGLLSALPWQTIFLLFTAAILSMILLLPFLGKGEGAVVARDGASLSGALRRAARDPSFTLIFLGFFSCGYQLGFMTAHFPALVTEMCGPIAPGGVLDSMGVSTTSALGAMAFGLVGLANIGGTLFAGWAGKRFPKKYLLSTIYTLRTVVAAAFILFPITPFSVIVFAILMGSLWLATVPLTSGLVGHIYGMRFMGTLYGIVFLSHQIGSFAGIWLGGRLYDATGDYTLVWWIGVAVGAFSAIVHLPIRERPLGAPAAPA